MKYFVSFAITFFALVSWGRMTDGKATVKAEGKKLVLTVASGFHFNKDAPAALTVAGKDMAPTKKEEQEFNFDVSKVEGQTFTVGYYICDDKKTVCEEHKENYSLQKGQLKAMAVAGVAPAVAAEKAKPEASAKVHTNSHGFIENNLQAALAKATKENKLVLVDYGAPWCPACVRLETEVFGTKLFKNATKDVVKLALNADMASNKAFGEQYKIKALPTLLILKGTGEEIYRSLDFKPAATLAKELAAEFKKKDTSLADLEKKAKAGDHKAMEAMAERSLNMLDFATATKWYEKLQDKGPVAAYAEINFWTEKNEEDSKANREGYIQVLKKWIAQDPQSYNAISARNDLADRYKEEKNGLPADVKKELEKNLEILPALASSKEKTHQLFMDWKVSDYTPYEQEEILAQWLSTSKTLKKETEEKQIVAKLQDLLKKKNLDVKRPGEILMGLGYFRKAQMTAEEEAWLTKLVKTYPDTYVYHMKMARFYSREKQFAKALPEALKAVELGDDLRFHNLKSLAEIQKELNQKEEAKKSIEQALALPEAKQEKYKSIAKSLEDLKKSL